MSKKELIVPILAATVSLLFTITCLAVFFTKGKSKKWIARKMKIGGLLLSLTVVSCNKGADGGDPIPICYDVIAYNTMVVQTNDLNQLEINLDTGNIITGNIFAVLGDDFSFSLNDDNETKLQSGPLSALDGAFDENEEEFEIILNQNLNSGDYLLNLYDVSVDDQDISTPKRQINLIIKNE